MYGIFTYHKNTPNVGEYTSPMDDMGMVSGELCFFVIFFHQKREPEETCLTTMFIEGVRIEIFVLLSWYVLVFKE